MRDGVVGIDGSPPSAGRHGLATILLQGLDESDHLIHGVETTERFQRGGALERCHGLRVLLARVIQPAQPIPAQTRRRKDVDGVQQYPLRLVEPPRGGEHVGKCQTRPFVARARLHRLSEVRGARLVAFVGPIGDPQVALCLGIPRRGGHDRRQQLDRRAQRSAPQQCAGFAPARVVAAARGCEERVAVRRPPERLDRVGVRSPSQERARFLVAREKEHRPRRRDLKRQSREWLRGTPL